MTDGPIGVIGGTGLYELLDEPRHEHVDTPYGRPSAPVSLGRLAGRDVAFLTRHGTDHAVPPHLVNYRANLAALDLLGVRTLVTSSAVGSLRADYRPGDFVLTDQFVDRTSGRADTFVDGPPVSHLSLADPYCPELRATARESLADQDETFHAEGTAVVLQGPRFSTRAESRWFRAMGWDVLSMTQHPETTLARELGMCVVNVSFVSDLDAGVPGVQDAPVTGELVHQAMEAGRPRIRAALAALVRRVPEVMTCACRSSRIEGRSVDGRPGAH